jgi:colicin import membrane protein
MASQSRYNALYYDCVNAQLSSSARKNACDQAKAEKAALDAQNKSAAKPSTQTAATAAIEAQKKADEAAAAETKRVADLKAFNESVLGAQKTVNTANQSIQTQFAEQEEAQKQKDAIAQEAQVPVQAGSASGFDIGEAQKAGVAKTGAAPSGAGKGMRPGAGAQTVTPPSSQTGAERNRFALPEMKDIKLGGL